MTAGHDGGGPLVVSEYKTFRLEIDLIVEPGLALSRDIKTVLFDSVADLSCAGSRHVRRTDAPC